MACYNVMTILINNRRENAPELQKVLTKSGCIIKTRLGLHEAGELCSEEGLVILQLIGSYDQINALESEVNALDGAIAKNIEICSDW